MLVDDIKRDIQLWENALRLEKVLSLINEDLAFFFKKGPDYFGASEMSRLIFAKLKAPEDEDIDDDAAFMALNLSQALQNDEPPKTMFFKKDLPKIKIIDKEKIEKLIKKLNVLRDE